MPSAAQWAQWLTAVELEDIAATLIKALPAADLTDLLHLVADRLRSTEPSTT